MEVIGLYGPLALAITVVFAFISDFAAGICCKPDNPLKGDLIRLVNRACKEMEYHSVLGLNILTILI